MNPRVISIAAVVLLLSGLLVYSQLRPQPTNVSGMIEADEIRVGSRVGGRVVEVLAAEGQKVKPGDLLVRLEPFDLLQRKAEANARAEAAEANAKRLKVGYRAEELGQAEARVERLEAVLKKLVEGPREEEIAAAKSRLTLAVATLERATQDLTREQRLAETRGAVTQEQIDRRVEETRIAKANREVREQELLLLQRGTRAEDIDEARAQLKEAREAAALIKNGYRPEDIEQAAATAAAAKAAVSVIEEQLKELEIRAPVEGTVEAIELQPGDLVAASAPVLSLLDEAHPWVKAYVPENRLGFKLNDTLKVTVDSYPGETFTGRVTFVARQAEFTPSNVQTIEERSKQVVRIKVSLDNLRGRLRPGMSVDVWLPPITK